MKPFALYLCLALTIGATSAFWILHYSRQRVEMAKMRIEMSQLVEDRAEALIRANRAVKESRRK